MSRKPPRAPQWVRLRFKYETEARIDHRKAMNEANLALGRSKHRARGKKLAEAKAEIADYLARNPTIKW